MISVLSGIVLMLAIGTLVQRGDVVAEFFSGEPDPIVLARDAVAVDADTLARIDVLSNDSGLADRDAGKLVVLSQPECGRVFVQDGALQYLGDRECAPVQRIVYGISGLDTEVAGEVEVTLRGVALVSRPANSDAEEPVVALGDATGSKPAAAPLPVTSPVSPAREPAPTRPVAGSQGLGRVAGGAGAGDAPARPGLASADAPAATAVPSVQAPATPSIAAPSSIPQIATDAPSVSVAGGGAGSGPARPAPASDLALTAPGLPLPPASPAGVDAAAESPTATPGPLASAEPAPSLPPSGPSVPAPSALAEPSSPSVPADIASGLVAPTIASEPGLAGLGTSDAALSRATPDDIGQTEGRGIATIALARVEVPDIVAAPAAARSQDLSLDVSNEQSAPSSQRLAPEIDAGDGQRITMLEPSAGLGEILSFGVPLTLRPIDTSVPTLSAPAETSGATAPDLRQAALQPSASQLPGAEGTPSAQPGALAQPDRVASLPRVDQTCAVPPSITLDIRPAGETELVITSPCHADSIALLSYEGLDLGIRIDRSGQGALSVLGLRSSSDAVLAFTNGETLEFSLPFTGTDRIERVALAWDAPVALELHAMEFGAAEGAAGHINPANPGDFNEVRRRGGGYLTTYAPVEGVGQSVQIYTHWLRRGGEAGVVKLYIDFASRHRERLAGTCGDGPLARPAFTVVRSSRGRIESPVSRRLASVDCAVVETTQNHLIEAAVRDIIISQR